VKDIPFCPVFSWVVWLVGTDKIKKEA